MTNHLLFNKHNIKNDFVDSYVLEYFNDEQIFE